MTNTKVRTLFVTAAMSAGLFSLGIGPASAEEACGDGTATGVYLYEHYDYDTTYGGQCSFFTSSSPDASTWIIGDNEASSIRIVGDCSATLYDRANYKKKLATFTSDLAEFPVDSGRRAGINDRTSSIKVICA